MNATSKHLQVICAWPVSGQYGPGSRVLYYTLIAACVFARKAIWLRNACLAAALLFPAVAAVHGIVLAAVHNDNAVDMDVYGAFQLCSIGILAAPVTVRLSRTYFYDPSRNTIFLWTGLILAGLLSLTVEFFRIGTSSCTHDDSNNPISPKAGKFPYNITCGLTCTINNGPHSPLRGGSTNNIYVIPAPDKLTFETATLLAAGCCIPAILSLVSMWDKILKINWKTRWGDRNEDKQVDQLIDGTNGATVEKMRSVNSWIRLFLSAVEIPVFSGAVLAILIVGERNFFSHQVNYQTEPIASIGQWAPIVGTSLAALGSLYHLLAVDIDAVKKESMQEAGAGLFAVSSNSVAIPGATDMRRSISNESGGTNTSERMPTTHPPTPARDVGNRRKVAKALTGIHNYLGTAAHDRFDDSAFKRGKALDFPEIPGEEHRNIALNQIREQYNPSRDTEGNVTPELRSRSSFAGSTASIHDVEMSMTTSDAASPQSLQSPYSLSPLPQLPTAPGRQHASSLPTQGSSFEPQSFPLSLPAGSSGGRLQKMRDTLQVPSPVHHSPTRNNISASSNTSIVILPEGQGSPAIVGSSDANTSSPAQTPVADHPALPSPSESLLKPPAPKVPPEVV